ncbi:MAG: hypothetical protein OER90_13135 [Gemmatimonadota bacterium]|nr:hypothetical protein [Gemmatimonadota bacterium]
MRRIRTCVALIAVLVCSVTVAHAQTMVLQQNKCDMGKVGTIRAFVDSAFVPIAQELVNEGKIMGFHSAFHAWGDEWNVVYIYVAEDIPAFLNAFGEAFSRMTERYPEAMPMMRDWCFEHKDSFLSMGKMTEHAPMPGR